MIDPRPSASLTLFCAVVTFAACCSPVLASPPEEPTEELASRVIARSLPAIRKGGESWISDKDCLSCHRVSFQVWALNRAEERGFNTDHRQLAEWNSWATSWKNMVNPKRRAETTMEAALTSESDTVAQLLLGRPQKSAKAANLERSETQSNWIATYREHLAKAQRDDGSWAPAGQLPQQKRSLKETTEVTTMWSMLALGDSGMPAPELDTAHGRALKFLTTTEPQSTEWLATRLLVERQFGSSVKADSLRKKLFQSQRADGGWGWLIEEKSDALGTGIALYALARDGVTFADTPVQRAVAFLAETQQPDGTWEVHGTKSGYRDSVVETASYWGTAWAAIGLLEFNPEGGDEVVTMQSPAKRSSSDDSPPVAGDEFATQIRPLLVKYCNDCHAGENSGSLNFMNLKSGKGFPDYQHLFVSVVREMERGAMPPADTTQPTAKEKHLLTSWLRSRLQELTPPDRPIIPDSSRQIGQYVVSSYEDRNGHLWFGTMGKGAARYDGKSVTYLTQKDGLPGGGVTSFAEDSGGNLWIGTQEGICRYDGTSFRRFGASDGLPLLRDARSPAPPGGGNVFVDRKGNIWANMFSGVFRWQDGRFIRLELPVDREKIRSYGLVPGYAALRLEDRDGNQWFTVDGYGVLRFDGKSFTRFTQKDGLCSNNVNDILQDSKGNLWFICMQSHQPKQTGDGGVCRFDGENFQTFPDVKGLHNNDIYTIGMDRKGNVWIGATGVGVYRYDGERFDFFDQTDRMDLTWARGLQAFHQARNGTIWLGFSGGLFRVHGDAIINVDRDGPWGSL